MNFMQKFRRYKQLEVNGKPVDNASALRTHSDGRTTRKLTASGPTIGAVESGSARFGSPWTALSFDAFSKNM